MKLPLSFALASAALFHGVAASAAEPGKIAESPQAVNADSANEAGPWTTIAFEMRSWGKPLSSWGIIPGGSGSWTETITRPEAAMGAYSLAYHEIEAGDAGWRELASITARLPDPAPDFEKCANFMTDLPYGTIRLTRGATTIEIAWNSGCTDPGYLAFLDTLQAADRLVTSWGKAGKIIRTEEVTP